ncbi:zinc finger protein 850-like protein [Platysternon megacephalum]|uniref:Zinc finger protein 850-like protein n=1 Tax=Platysternon megacephalum TaxID=55544 RepID=A0A4D9DT40_9SAUR|nr:zinc finger protein 850-like protein [Platysternon megacephalum]
MLCGVSYVKPSGNEESPFILMAKLPLAGALITKVFGKSSFCCILTFQLQCVESLKGHSEKNIWIDSCIPETSTTLLSATDPEINSSSTASSQGITEMPTATESPKPQIPRKTFRIKCVTETILPTVQTTLESEEEMAVPNGNQAAFTNDSVVFGGVPIALLVLALVFFMASAVLAVCYIRKYKRTCPFSNKRPQKERIEAKVIKDAKTIDNAPEKESKNNGKKAEEPQTKPEATVKCVEAEV